MSDLTYLQSLLLGLIQGITEWLPVSSSGHLQIGRALLGLESSTWYDLLLHVGTLTVVIWVYRRRIGSLIMAAFGQKSTEKSFAWGLVIASIPIAVTGFLFNDLIESAFASLAIVGASLIFTAYFLSTTKGLAGERKVGPNSAWTVGLWQACALLPGVSRSGATIAGGLHAGLNREDAADFAFLLAIPALVGATLFKIMDLGSDAFVMTGPMVVGILASVVSGYVSLTWLRRLVARKGIHSFAPYCLVAGVFALLLASKHL